MKLIIKFNLVLLLVFAIGFVVVGYFSNRLLQRNAKQEILENARIMMEAALAVRTYTNTQIKPLLETQLKYSFLPQSVPAYSANEYFNQLRKTFPDYSYKEATLNPTNPVNRATDWEADIVRYFRQTPAQTEEVGERDTPNGRVLYMARALKIKDAKCLFCHDTPELAPRTLIDRYGSANGFGWKLNDVIDRADRVGAHAIAGAARPDCLRRVHGLGGGGLRGNFPGAQRHAPPAGNPPGATVVPHRRRGQHGQHECAQVPVVGQR